MTRQRQCQLNAIARGICAQCITRPIHPGSKANCYHCLVKGRVRQRKRKGYKPKYESGVGRPTITRTPSPEQSDLCAA